MVDFSQNDFSNDFDIGVGGMIGQITSTIGPSVSNVAEVIGISASLLGVVIIAIAFIAVLAVWYVKETK